MVNEDPVEADAIVVLGGGVDTRTFAAADAYRQGLVDKVLIPRVVASPVEEQGVMESHTELCRQVVLAKGVPSSAIELFGQDVSSTWEEAEAIKRWAADNDAKILLVPTEFPHTRRLRWVMDKMFGNSDTRAVVMAIDAHDYDRGSWWSDEDGLIDMQNEFVKYLYYRLNY